MARTIRQCRSDRKGTTAKAWRGATQATSDGEADTRRTCGPQNIRSPSLRLTRPPNTLILGEFTHRFRISPECVNPGVEIQHIIPYRRLCCAAERAFARTGQFAPTAAMRAAAPAVTRGRRNLNREFSATFGEARRAAGSRDQDRRLIEEPQLSSLCWCVRLTTNCTYRRRRSGCLYAFRRPEEVKLTPISFVVRQTI
jgi:hypothetical protein